jgi:hypothetical protein
LLSSITYTKKKKAVIDFDFDSEVPISSEVKQSFGEYRSPDTLWEEPLG